MTEASEGKGDGGMSGKPQKKQSGNDGASIGVILVILAVAVVLIGGVIAAVLLTRGGEGESSSAASGAVSPMEEPTGDASHVYVQMSFDGFGDIVLELAPEAAPVTVQNFVDLTEDGFYNGLTIHRISKNFVIQGGDPKGDGTGGSDPIKGEFLSNGYDNPIPHKRGVISMARRSGDNNSGSSQFFICLSDATASQLDGQYASFGWVYSGMDVVDAIAAVETNAQTERPNQTITITEAKVLPGRPD